MKLILKHTHDGDRRKLISLQNLTDQILQALQPKAIASRSFFLNEVKAGMEVNANEELLYNTILQLLEKILTQSPDSCIRIHANSHKQIVLLHIKATGKSLYSNQNICLDELQTQAEKMGGCIFTSQLEQPSMTFTMSFVSAA